MEDPEAMEVLDSAVVISTEEDPLQGLAGLVLGLQGLEDVVRFLDSNARLFRSNHAKTCLDSSVVAFLDSSAGVSLDSSAASSVSQSAGARFAPSCKGQEGLSRLAVRLVIRTTG